MELMVHVLAKAIVRRGNAMEYGDGTVVLRKAVGRMREESSKPAKGGPADSRYNVLAHGLPFRSLRGAALTENLVHFFFCLFAVQTIALLKFTEQLLRIALNLHHIVVGELAPLTTNVALHLIPSTFQNIGIHTNLLSMIN